MNFLIDIWKDMPSKDKLLIICDELKTDIKLPKNIIIRRDITGENQYKYIINCNAMIIPIKDGSILFWRYCIIKRHVFL